MLTSKRAVQSVARLGPETCRVMIMNYDYGLHNSSVADPDSRLPLQQCLESRFEASIIAVFRIHPNFARSGSIQTIMQENSDSDSDSTICLWGCAESYHQ